MKLLILFLALSLLISFVYCSENNVNKIIMIERQLIKSGFHKTLRTSFHLPKDIKNDNLLNITLVENVQKDIYFDIYEIKNFKNYFTINNHQKYIDIEKPSYLIKDSEYVTISFHQLLSIDTIANHITTFEIPIHFRYQFPKEKLEYEEIKVLDPKFVIINNVQYEIIKASNITDDNSLVDIPIGNIEHFKTVQFVTIFITCLSSLLIIIFSFIKKN
ncbi:hypothetical protein ABK040_002150 [Willaertia magna]